MDALTVRPGVRGSLEVRDIADPPPSDGDVLVETLAVGLCGTDVEIVDAQYGQAPAGQDYLVLGHENLGRVQAAPANSGLSAGDLVVGIVRRPDPLPCPACAAGEWDMCRNGRYTEHGIVGLHGFARTHWRAFADGVVPVHRGLAAVGVLLEPTTIVAKAWEQVERIGARAFWQPTVAAVIGAGPVGLLAAMLGVQRGLQVHVFDVVADGLKPQLVRALGATYHNEPLGASGLAPDVIVECTGAPKAVLDALTLGAADRITCLTGVSGTGRMLALDLGLLNRDTVLRNDVVFGSVNANRRHYEQAAAALLRADASWLAKLITRRVPLAQFADAFERRPDDVKVVLDLADVAR